MERTPLLPTLQHRPASSIESESFVPTLFNLQILAVGIAAMTVSTLAFTQAGTVWRDAMVVAVLVCFHAGVGVCGREKVSSLGGSLVTKSLEFGPTPYIYRIDGLVPVSYCFMWSIPLFIGLALALSARDALDQFTIVSTARNFFTSPTSLSDRLTSLTSAVVSPRSSTSAYLAAIASVGGILCLSELPASSTAAVYVLPAELVLGAVSMAGYLIVEGDGWGRKVVMGALVALVYTGAITIAYGVIEG
ncbi:hypothetical protein BC829DRAFT_486289 [Chytridium lagenaria]|nr:hypothetical protein BC829DRAFT_486289 [Chytridium lagenaria]